MATTWETLSEVTVIDLAQEALGQRFSNFCLKRNSYINRVFELELTDTSEHLIVKFYRPGRWSKETIQAEHHFLQELANHEIAVIPPLSFNGKTIFEKDNIFFTFFPKKGGRALDEFDQELWLQVGRLIGRIHLVSKTLQIQNRITWRPDLITTTHLQILEKANCLPPEYHQPFFSAANALIKSSAASFTKPEYFALHGDCHRGNLIFRPNEGVYLIDFDDMVIGPAVQDLWLLLPDTPENCKKEINWFISGYETFLPFNRQHLALIPALRGMRIIHFAAWCALQQHEPNFKETFCEWGTPRYWNDNIKNLNEIITIIQSPLDLSSIS